MGRLLFAATEVRVQELELDWIRVTWDADLRFHRAGWGCRDVRGSKWQNVRSVDSQRGWIRGQVS